MIKREDLPNSISDDLPNRQLHRTMTQPDQLDWDDDELFSARFSGQWRNGVWMGKLEQAFWEFHNANPIVYQILVRCAFEWKNAGHTHCGINFLVERARWELGVTRYLEADENDLKLNNNHAPFYARLIEEKQPELKDFFRKRRQQIQSSFGPANETLPPGDHIA